MHNTDLQNALLQKDRSNASHTVTVVETRELLEKSEIIVTQLRSDLSSSRNELDAANRRVVDLEAQNRSLQDELANARSEAANLRNQLEQANRQRQLDRVAKATGQAQTDKTRSYPRGKFPFFGLEVADGIKFKEEFGGRQAYGAVKVVKVWGPSSTAGIQALDFIRTINGVHVTTLVEFKDVMSKIQPNTQVPISVERQHRELSFLVNTDSCDAAPGSVHHTNIIHARLSIDDSPTRSSSPEKSYTDPAMSTYAMGHYHPTPDPEARERVRSRSRSPHKQVYESPYRRPSPQLRNSPRGEAYY
eukprot:TRINITY_DN59909_c0_g1_i1.p1 TRINITY_DN59909_c0_g1~~TRINITY_DN59909_c0_g1_i1.p1  ORF type:complete len:304 (+),score=27.74 TRINITY_DN59909_c0_g1_i1:485-1396(+)